MRKLKSNRKETCGKHAGATKSDINSLRENVCTVKEQQYAIKISGSKK